MPFNFIDNSRRRKIKNKLVLTMPELSSVRDARNAQFALTECLKGLGYKKTEYKIKITKLT